MIPRLHPYLLHSILLLLLITATPSFATNKNVEQIEKCFLGLNAIKEKILTKKQHLNPRLIDSIIGLKAMYALKEKLLTASEVKEIIDKKGTPQDVVYCYLQDQGQNAFLHILINAYTGSLPQKPIDGIIKCYAAFLHKHSLLQNHTDTGGIISEAATAFRIQIGMATQITYSIYNPSLKIDQTEHIQYKLIEEIFKNANQIRNKINSKEQVKQYRDLCEKYYIYLPKFIDMIIKLENN